MAIKKVVVLGEDLCIRTEGIAGGVVTPGHLVEGPATAVVVHSGATLTAAKKFAYERELTGGQIDDDYASADTILLVTAARGAIIYAIAGTGGVTAEAFVDSLGDGRLGDVVTDVATDDTQRGSVVGKAMDTATVGNRFRCEIL